MIAEELPAVSLVLPVFNHAETLPACLDSLEALDYPSGSLEVLVVDNASTDATPRILAGRSSRFRVLYRERRGVAAARNGGLRHARHPVLATTDADCTVEPSWLRELVRPLVDPAVGITGGRILARVDSSEIERFGELIHDHETAIHRSRPPYVITMSWASRRDVIDRCGDFDEDLRRGSDVDMSIRVHRAGYRLAYVPEAVVRHRNRSTFHELFHEGFLHGRGSVQVIKKHFETLRAEGHRRIHPREYRRILGDLRRYWRPAGTVRDLCSFYFNLGKGCGKILGSLRFRHLSL